MKNDQYSIKDREYFANIRVDVVSLIPANPAQKILEIGAGTGNTLVYIKEKGIAAEVAGVELMKLPGTNQENPVIDHFQIANIETEEIRAQESYFDVILCADVLEHLVDPWTAVKKISRFLKPGGSLIVSMPNLREYKNLAKIVFRGEFNYQTEGGIMDRTHLRFFCRKNIAELLTTDELTPVYDMPNFLLKVLPEGRTRRILNAISLGLFENFLTVQYLFIARKK